MGKKKQPSSGSIESFPKARTTEGRDNQLIALTYDVVEQRLRDGTATSQETTFFLKLAAQREKAQLELDILREQQKLMEAKTETLKSAKRNEELLNKAMTAFASYRSTADDHD